MWPDPGAKIGKSGLQWAASPDQHIKHGPRAAGHALSEHKVTRNIEGDRKAHGNYFHQTAIWFPVELRESRTWNAIAAILKRHVVDRAEVGISASQALKSHVD